MWFPLSLVAMLMLVSRRSTEKKITGKISASAMAWLQQLVGLPFMALLLPFAAFYNPLDLPVSFIAATVFYVVLASIDVILYFKAIEVGDISIISPLISLAIVTNLIGTYAILGQKPSLFGLIGSVLILVGAYFAGKRSKHHHTTAINNGLAILLVLIIVCLRGLHSPMEIIALRHSNPIYFNFITSVMGIPFIMFIMYMRERSKGKNIFTPELRAKVFTHRIGLLVIGLSYTLNLTCTYAAKYIAPNAAYVTTVKSTQVVPMVIMGVLFFNEHVTRRQWLGTGLITVGLFCFLRA